MSGTSYNFYVGALPAGDYWVAITPAGGNPATSSSYSPGCYHVDGTPTLAFTSPSEEGSATTSRRRSSAIAWDMDSLTDIDYVRWGFRRCSPRRSPRKTRPGPVSGQWA